MGTGNPKVTVREIDISDRVPSPPSIAAAIAIQSVKGPWNPTKSTSGEARTGLGIPTLITNKSQLIDFFGAPIIGSDKAYYSALSYLDYADNLWVVRAGTDTLKYGSRVMIGSDTDDWEESAAALGVADIEPFDFVGTSDSEVVLYGVNPGDWNNNIQFTLTEETTLDAAYVDLTEVKAYNLNVYFSTGSASTATLVESFLVSPVEAAVDGDGNSLFIEDVLQASLYLRADVEDTYKATLASEMYEESTAIALTKGADDSSFDATERVTNYGFAMDQFLDTDQYKIALLLSGGWGVINTGAGTYNAGHATTLATIAATRNDCLAIITGDPASEIPYTYMSTSDSVTSIPNDAEAAMTAVGSYKSYCAYYAPTVKILDPHTGRTMWIACDGYVGGIIAQNDVRFERWYSPAGWRRAQLPVMDVRRRFTTGERDTLYDLGINSIRYQAGRGIVIWGDKTMQRRPSALDRVNVRLFLTVMEPQFAVALENFIFEFNDEITRRQVTALLSGAMEDFKARRAVTEYLVKCDTDNNTDEVIDRYEMLVWVFIKPTRVINWIKFGVIITRTSARLVALGAEGGF